MSQLTADPSGTSSLEQYRPELTGYCYRMLGSAFDADDAVQDTMVRAWQALDRFEGRSSLRSWLYRIATNVCLDKLRSRQRRALPMELSDPVSPLTAPSDMLPEQSWLQPMADGEITPATGDPADRVALQDTIRLAFVAALQHLPPRQRAVLILREVLSWSAAEVAELLGTTVASVNSALQRARATIAAAELDPDERAGALGGTQRALLDRYVAAFEAYDMEALVGLLHEDASFSMPPFVMWFRGKDNFPVFYQGHGSACRGSRLIPVAMNGSPAFAHYKPDGEGGYDPWAIQVLELRDGQIAHIHHFLDPALFTRFGLPARLGQDGAS
ncbi:MAG: sigma-70 family RNA polymerase sigma factor [Gemmatimonadota bacterium]